MEFLASHIFLKIFSRKSSSKYFEEKLVKMILIIEDEFLAKIPWLVAKKYFLIGTTKPRIFKRLNFMNLY